MQKRGEKGICHWSVAAAAAGRPGTCFCMRLQQRSGQAAADADSLRHRRDPAGGQGPSEGLPRRGRAKPQEIERRRGEKEDPGGGGKTQGRVTGGAAGPFGGRVCGRGGAGRRDAQGGGGESLQFGHMDTAMEAKKGDETAAETKHRTVAADGS